MHAYLLKKDLFIPIAWWYPHGCTPKLHKHVTNRFSLLIVPEFSISLIDCTRGCNLKICSEKCDAKYQRHSDEECQLVQKISDTNPHKWLTVLRVLLMKKNHPDFWNKFVCLEDHLQDRSECSIMKGNKVEVYKVLKHFAPELMNGKHHQQTLIFLFVTLCVKCLKYSFRWFFYCS